MGWLNNLNTSITGPLKPPTKPLAPSTGALKASTTSTTPTTTSVPSKAPQPVSDQSTVLSGTQKLPQFAATTSTAATAGTTSISSFPVYDQRSISGGQQNSCGTTSLSEILNYWNPSGPGQSTKEIDSSIRKSDFGASMVDLVSYAQSHGMRASIKSDASLDDIASMIDQGVPVQVLIDPDQNKGDTVLHYVNVVGVTRDASNKITSLQIADSATGTITSRSASEFMNQWSNLKELNVSTGWNCMMMTYVPNDNRVITAPDGTQRKANTISLPSGLSSSAEAALQVGQGGADFINGWKSKRYGQMLTGAADVVGGATALLGANMVAAGDRLRKNHGGLYKLLGGALRLGGLALNKAAKVASSVVKEGIEVASKIVSAGKKVVSSIGNAVSKVFSGW